MPIPWNLDELYTSPTTYAAPEYAQRGVEALFFEGVPYQGRPTRVFAFYGAPSVPVDGPVPGIVLVHGGGGTAFADWVRLWNARGYAAIAMDLNGQVPVGEYNKWTPHEYGGPAGISFPASGGFDQIEKPLTDQWYFHAVAAAIRAHSLLASKPDVDASRIGITGISWGGFTTCIVAGVDTRLKFSVPVYGCGYIEPTDWWAQDFERIGPEGIAKWQATWDPKNFLPRVTIPTLWVTGTNDFAYPLPSLQKSYRLPQAPHKLCIRVRMGHGHGGLGENPQEIKVFADSLLNGGAALPTLTNQGIDGAALWAEYDSPVKIAKAEMNYTLSDNRDWQQREWLTVPATLDAAAGRVSGAVPSGATTAYLNLYDARDCVVSSEHVVFAA
jgi:dienelactone hydrolase